jgi:hypothetical protein
MYRVPPFNQALAAKQRLTGVQSGGAEHVSNIAPDPEVQLERLRNRLPLNDWYSTTFYTQGAQGIDRLSGL